MEDLTPPLLKAVRELSWLISSGRSMNEALRLYLAENHDDVASDLRERWTLKRSTGAHVARPFRNPYRRALWDLIERGTAGQPVFDSLRGLEQEVERETQAELDRHLAALPFKLLLPLLGLQFPAYLLLLLGPVLRDLNRQLGGG